MPPKSKKEPKYPVPSRGSKMTLSLEGNALIAVPFQMKPMVPSATGRMVAHTYCAAHRSRVKSGGQVCLEHGETCEETFSGYEWEDVVVEVDKKSIGVESDKTLVLKALIDAGDVDPLYVEKSYMMFAEEGAETAFDQIAAALKVSGKAAVGTAVIRDATKAIVVRWSPLAACLIAHVCTYDARILWEQVGLIEAGQVMREQPTDEAAKAAAELLAQHLDDEFDFGSVEDEFAAELEAAVEAAATGAERPVKPEAAPMQPVGDLMAALAAGVDGTKKKPAAKKPRAKKAA